ncbi:uncharacterized protein EURHEDRAFT_410132 [Aspergillus ruber CBS 135680]|uniref:Uncharacterized protein n=1 Tax=Aspergillus ruber (strain CBS 135680) TaxID=1388766 RepID=A0A017SJI0_ASPRC|nr:uncharacterized protein EURHEDRAFT_410132 [Aspergillus ruber CBS 135680]EYE97093.1 hypothetical protein EURHEDRAFT_410132 [Aspergillus ruber CBS 135680]
MIACLPAGQYGTTSVLEPAVPITSYNTRDFVEEGRMSDRTANIHVYAVQLPLLIIPLMRQAQPVTTREQLRLETRALCFEMEAASLILDFPCIVICGVYVTAQHSAVVDKHHQHGKRCHASN